MFNLFLAVSPEIFLINATFILLIHGVVFSTYKKYDYPPLVSNVGWLGLLSVARLGRQRALGCRGSERKPLALPKQAHCPSRKRVLTRNGFRARALHPLLVEAGEVKPSSLT
jgi:NADH-ubiquinone oxidoreductase chain 2